MAGLTGDCVYLAEPVAVNDGRGFCELSYSWSVKITCLPPVIARCLENASIKPVTLFEEVKKGGKISI